MPPRAAEYRNGGRVRIDVVSRQNNRRAARSPHSGNDAEARQRNECRGESGDAKLSNAAIYFSLSNDIRRPEFVLVGRRTTCLRVDGAKEVGRRRHHAIGRRPTVNPGCIYRVRRVDIAHGVQPWTYPAANTPKPRDYKHRAATTTASRTTTSSVADITFSKAGALRLLVCCCWDIQLTGKCISSAPLTNYYITRLMT